MQTKCALYLRVTISDFHTVFAARIHGIFLSYRPGVLLACAAVFATSIFTLLSWLWPFPDMETATRSGRCTCLSVTSVFLALASQG